MRNSNRDLQGKILGTCILEKSIGHGGMSVVYLARQKKPERYVAVKVVHPAVPIESGDYSTFLARFQREADIIAKLEHINIIPIFEYGEQEEMAYLVMPYASGGNLSQILKQQGKFTAVQAMKYLQQAADALDYAHEHNIIHRDLKPSNFLLYADKRLVLADFGIAQMTRDNITTSNELTLTPAGVLMGTPAYIAPEMWQGRGVDHRADIYALGIILFQMLSGELPFQGSEYFVILHQHLNTPLPLLHRINPSIPWKIDTVLQKATAKEKEERYESAGQFARAFLSAITSSEKNTYNSVPSTFSKGTPLTVMEPLQYKYPAQISEAQNEAPAQQYQASSIEIPKLDTFSPIHPTSPATPSKKRRYLSFSKSKALPITVIIFSILFIALGSIGAFANHPSTSKMNITPVVSPTLTPTKNAEALVQRYYNYINQQNYIEAYKLLTPAFRDSLSYENFAKGYVLTIHDDIIFNSVQIRYGGSIEVSITIHATESMNNGMIKNIYTWDTIVTHQDGRWEIASAITKKM